MALRHNYSEAFQIAWKAYPHHKDRRCKVAAFKEWKRLRLEGDLRNVLAWIEFDGKLDGGQYTPSMERWLKRIDFNEPPPSVGRAKVAAPETKLTMFNVWDKLIDAASHLAPEQRKAIKPEIERMVPDVVAGRLTARQAVEAAEARVGADP